MMMSNSSSRRTIRQLVVVAAALAVAGSAGAQAQAGAPTLKWGPAPAVFPKGAKMAVISGDPSKSGPFTVALAFPAGYRIAPHWHPTDENVTVKSGTMLLGMGDKLDRKATKAFKAGESASVKADMHHYAVAKTKAQIEVSSVGPFAMTYVNAKDDPSKKK